MWALVMDGDPHASYAISHMLTTAGLIVDHAESAMQGLRLARMNHYDVVLTDLILPDLSGRELVRHIRSTDPARPVLVLSGVDGGNARTVALEAGADGYMRKPVDRNELLTRVGRLLGHDTEALPPHASSDSSSSTGHGSPALRAGSLGSQLPRPRLSVSTSSVKKLSARGN